MTILLDFPASPQVIAVGGYIVASADPTCTEEEITSLVETESSLGEAAEFLAEAFEEANDNLEEATGSTVTAAPTTTTTSAPTTAPDTGSKLQNATGDCFCSFLQYLQTYRLLD